LQQITVASSMKMEGRIETMATKKKAKKGGKKKH